MNTIIEKVYAVILGCGDIKNKTNEKFRRCIRDRVKGVVEAGMSLVASKKFSKKKSKEMIEGMVMESLMECADSVRRIRPSKNEKERHNIEIEIEMLKDCIYQNSTPLISIAVDIMMFLV